MTQKEISVLIRHNLESIRKPGVISVRPGYKIAHQGAVGFIDWLDCITYFSPEDWPRLNIIPYGSLM